MGTTESKIIDFTNHIKECELAKLQGFHQNSQNFFIICDKCQSLAKSKLVKSNKWDKSQFIEVFQNGYSNNTEIKCECSLCNFLETQHIELKREARNYVFLQGGFYSERAFCKWFAVPTPQEDNNKFVKENIDNIFDSAISVLSRSKGIFEEKWTFFGGYEYIIRLPFNFGKLQISSLYAHAYIIINAYFAHHNNTVKRSSDYKELMRLDKNSKILEEFLLKYGKIEEYLEKYFVNLATKYAEIHKHLPNDVSEIIRGYNNGV